MTRSRRRLARPLAAALLAGLVACGGSDAPTWDWGLSPATRTTLADRSADLAALDAALDGLFGTPAEPRLAPLADGSEPWRLEVSALSERLAQSVRIDNEAAFHDELVALDAGRVAGVDWSHLVRERGAAWERAVAAGADEGAVAAEAAAALRAWLPALSRSSTVYARQCIACHGREGGGDGPSATYLKPAPRDFRSGDFKYFRRDLADRPRRDDLVDVLYNGIKGSGMAAFRRLSSAELVGLADWVRFLSVRGTTERGLAAELERGGALDEATVQAIYADAWAPWLARTDASDAGGTR